MKRAIVLAGGGTKGAYQAGALRALKELGIKFDIVTGTSIGSLNGCLLAQKDQDAMYTMWQNLTVDDIMADGIDMKFTVENMMNQTDQLKPFLKTYVSNKGANIDPLKELIHRMCNEDKLRSTGIDFGLVTVEYPSLKPVEITYSQMDGHLEDYLIASASCFPAFPIHEFNGHGYIDGGYFDNLPIDLAFQMGADDIIAMELTYDRHTHPNYENRPNIHYIRPSQYNGQFLDFNPELTKFRLKLGYNDAMKMIGGYPGKKFTFYPEMNHDLVECFYNKILRYEAALNREFVKKAINESKPLTKFIEEVYPAPTKEDYLIFTLEILCERYKLDSLEIYSIDELVITIKDLFLKEYSSIENVLNLRIKSLGDTINKEYFEELSKENMLMAYYYHNIIHNSVSNTFSPVFNLELLCAFLLVELCRS